jgi:signal transduction histidine kinase
VTPLGYVVQGETRSASYPSRAVVAGRPSRRDLERSSFDSDSFRRDVMTLASIGATLAAAVVIDASVKPRGQFVSSPFAVPILVATERLPPLATASTGVVTMVVAAVAARLNRSPRTPSAFHILGLGIITALAFLWGEQRRATTRQALRATVEREEWTSEIAHDLRQPVTVITAYASRLRSLLVKDGSPEERQGVEHVLSSAGNLNQMIADLLDASRIDVHRLTLRRQTTDLPSLARAVVDRCDLTPRNHRVQVIAKGDIPPVAIDAGRVEQVMSNLLSNAAKYGYPNTEIQVELEREGQDVLVSVTNRGDGISPDELPRIFKRFYRTREARAGDVAGIGLGLTIAKRLVEAHGGHIWAESTPGQTTTFHFTLPIAASTANR